MKKTDKTMCDGTFLHISIVQGMSVMIYGVIKVSSVLLKVRVRLRGKSLSIDLDLDIMGICTRNEHYQKNSTQPTQRDLTCERHT